MEPKSTIETAIEVTAGSPPSTQPPIAVRKPVEHLLHGDLRVDDYGWLREKQNPEVIRHLEAENSYTEAALASTNSFQENLYQEMLARIQQTDLSVPYRLRGYLYFSKTLEGKQYPLHYRRPADESSCVGAQYIAPQTGNQLGHEADQLLLDLNALAEGHSFLGLDAFEVSDNNHLLAYSTDTTGFRQYTLQIKDLTTGQLLLFRAERVTSTAWSSDSKTLFYTVEDPVTKRSHRLYRHTLGDLSADPLIFDEPDERFRIEIDRTRSKSFLLLLCASHTASEVRFLAADNPLGDFRLIAPREDSHEYYVEHHPALNIGGTTANLFLVRTNSGGRTFRLATAPLSDPQRSNWRELIANRPEVMLSSLEPFRSHLVLFEREDGLPFLRIVQLSWERQSPDWRLSDQPLKDLLANSYRIPFAEPAYNAAPGTNPEFDQSHFRYSYESFITPRSVFDFDVSSRQSTLRKRQPVLGGYDSSLYATERLHALASDGPRIPLSVVYRKHIPRDGSARAHAQ